jgi:integrase
VGSNPTPSATKRRFATFRQIHKTPCAAAVSCPFTFLRVSLHFVATHPFRVGKAWNSDGHLQMGKLTAKFVESARPGMHGDGGGLYLQVGKGDAAKSWVFRYKLAGKQRYMGLGSAIVVPLKKARELADAARLARAGHVDPINEREAKRAADRIEAAKVVTFGEYADRYISSHQAAWKNPVHRQQWRNTINQYAKPVLGPISLSEIDTAAVMRVLQPIWLTVPETASRVRGRIESILDVAKVEGLRNGENPARWRGHISHLLPQKGKVKPVKHHAAVPYAELPAFMAELRQRPSLSARALEFLILTATRASEACEARWEEIDLAKALWTIPASRMKGGKEHRVPLVGRSLAILEAYSDVQRRGLVFPSYNGKPLSIAAPGKLLGLMGRDETTHGFRSSFKDWAAETTNYPDWVSEKALAHTIGDETKRAYQRGDLLEKRRELMAAWDAYCEKERTRTLAERSETV